MRLVQTAMDTGDYDASNKTIIVVLTVLIYFLCTKILVGSVNGKNRLPNVKWLIVVGAARACKLGISGSGVHMDDSVLLSMFIGGLPHPPRGDNTDSV